MNSNNMDYLIRGEEYINEGDYDKAIEVYNTAISLKIEDADIYTARGQAYCTIKKMISIKQLQIVAKQFY